MTNKALSAVFTTVLTVCSIVFHQKLVAQDSTLLNSGCFSFRKSSTQYFTIPAKELRRFPFLHLEEAIGMYFAPGVLTRENTAYLVDGNLAVNIDALSIEDIESVTLVINAASLLNSVLPSQYMILISTKSGAHSKPGVVFSGSSYLTRTRDTINGKLYPQQTPTWLHNYHIGANGSAKLVNYGISADWLHHAHLTNDTIPATAFSPSRLDRFRVYGWLNASLGKASTLTLQLNAAREDSTAQSSFTGQLDKSYWQTKGREPLLFPSARLFSRLAERLTNDLNLSYTHDNQRVMKNFSTLTNMTSQDWHQHEVYKLKWNDFQIRDQLRWKEKVGNWCLDPSFGILFSRSSFKQEVNEASYGPGNSVGTRFAMEEHRGDPELNINLALASSYKEWFSVDGGIQYSLHKIPFFPKTDNSLLPFLSLSADLLKMFSTNASNSLMLYGSLSAGNGMEEKIYRSQVGYLNPPNVSFSPTTQTRPSKSWTLGSVFKTSGDRFRLDYAFQKKQYHEFFITNNYNGGLIAAPAQMRTLDHYLIACYKANIYRTSISVSYLDRSFKPENSPPFSSSRLKIWSTVWGNNFQFKEFYAGLNAMYYSVAGAHSFMLQHVDIGHSGRVGRSVLDVYLSGRNLLQNKRSVINAGEISYWGAGLRMNFQ